MKESVIENRIYYHDTDCGGVVYYAAYLEHLEEGRSEHYRKAGIDLAAWARDRVVFPVAHLEVDYKSSARYGDMISIVTKVERLRNVSVHFLQEIRRGDTLLITAMTTLACVDLSMKPTRIPEEIRQALQ
jgi:acyl-CoA thioester hydrolase